MDKMYHNSHDLVYRQPFGAIESNNMLSISISVSKGKSLDGVFLILEKKDGEHRVRMEESDSIGDIVFFKTDIEIGDYMGLIFYYFIIYSSEGILFYGNNEEGLGGEGKLYTHNPKTYQITVYKNDYIIPSWFREAVVYQIFPDRFFRKDGEVISTKRNSFIYANWDDEPFYIKDKNGRIVRWEFFGGNIKGIIEKLPYLKDLGISVIYLNPIFEAASNHRYDTADYKSIDPLLGSEEDFIELCEKSDEIGISIILDGVFSHTGDDSIYFNRYGNYPELGAYESKDSIYYSWYRFKDGTKEYESWWGVDALPNVNELEPSYIDYIISDEDSVINHWMRKGARGWRLDVADELPGEFIKLLKSRMKQIDKDSVLIGEVWEDASNKISYDERREYFSGEELDSVTNYPLRQIFIDFITRKITAQDIHRRIMSLYENYPRENFFSLLNLISGHDVVRILTVLKESFGDCDMAIKALKLVITLQMTFPGVPCVYYGDEAGLKGKEDPDNRRTYPWGNEDKEILSYYRKMIHVRNKDRIFVYGDFESFYSGDTYGFKRSLNGEFVIVTINPHDLNQKIESGTIS